MSPARKTASSPPPPKDGPPSEAAAVADALEALANALGQGAHTEKVEAAIATLRG